MNMAGLKEQMRPEALSGIQSSLVLEQIAKEENIEVSEEDIDAEIEKMAAGYGMPADDLKNYVDDSGRDSIRRDLSLTKAADLVMANVKERAKAKSKKEEKED
jgi:trigger factor